MNILSLEVKKNIFACRRKKTLPNYNGLLKSFSGAYSIYNNTKLTETEKERWSVVKNKLLAYTTNDFILKLYICTI